MNVWSPQWSMVGTMVKLVTLSVVYLEFKAHLTSMASGIHHPIWFGLSGTIICFLTGQWPQNTPSVRVRRVMECCIRWPGLHNHLTSIQLRWFGIIWTSDSRKSICGNSFKTVGKTFLMELVERMPRVCKAVITAKGGYFEESLVTTWFHVCYFIVLMSSLLFYNVENSFFF